MPGLKYIVLGILMIIVMAVFQYIAGSDYFHGINYIYYWAAILILIGGLQYASSIVDYAIV